MRNTKEKREMKVIIKYSRHGARMKYPIWRSASDRQREIVQRFFCR